MMEVKVKTSEKKLVPQLRFREFVREWEEKSLGEICCINPSATQLPVSFVYIDLESVKGGQLICENQIDLDDAPSRAQRVLKPYDILYQTVRPYQKNNLFFNRSGNNVASSGYAVLRTEENPMFIFQLIHCDGFVNNVLVRCTGTSYPAINSKDLGKIIVSVPVDEEQQKIASFLSAVDEKIQQLSKKKALLEQYKKGVMQKLFSQEVRFKKEDGRDFPEWEEKRLGEICSINPSATQLPVSFVYIDLESVKGGQLICENQIDLDDAPSRAQRVLKPYDILYQTVRPYQKNNLFFNRSGNYVASSGYAVLRTEENPMFIFQLIHCDDFVNNVLVRCTGTSYPAINSKDLGKIIVSVPVDEEQQKIASFLTSIDTKIEQVATQMEQAQKFKKGLLQQMFV